MAVTVAVPTTGRSANLNRCVSSILAALDRLDTPGTLVVVVNGPEIGRYRPAIHDPRIRVVLDEVAGAARARNTVIALARHDIVLFTDDDCIVPPGWCADAVARMHRAGAVAAPVVVREHGPVTAFLNYKRVFTAPAIDERHVHYFVTANCGVRRSALPDGARFDDVLFNNAAEDSCLGYELNDSGVGIAWAGDSEPVVHELEESTSEVVERFLRYGRGNARLVNAHRRWRESVPGALGWLASIRAGRCRDYRRFVELPCASVRTAFTLLDLVQTSAWLVGFVLEMQDYIGVEVLAADVESLTDGFTALTESAAKDLTSGDSWDTPEPDLRRLVASVPVPSPAADQVAEVLQDALRLHDADAGRTLLVRHLSAAQAQIDEEQAAVRARAVGLSRELATMSDLAGLRGAEPMAWLEARLRAYGIGHADGLHEIEKAGWTREP